MQYRLVLLRIRTRSRVLLRRGLGPLLLRTPNGRRIWLIQLRGNRLKRERVAPAARYQPGRKPQRNRGTHPFASRGNP
jgi:hypothetical protein